MLRNAIQSKVIPECHLRQGPPTGAANDQYRQITLKKIIMYRITYKAYGYTRTRTYKCKSEEQARRKFRKDYDQEYNEIISITKY